MSVIPKLGKVLQRDVTVVSNAIIRLEKGLNTYSCIAIVQAFYLLEPDANNEATDELLEDYAEYVTSRVYQVQWDSHREDYEEGADFTEMFDTFFASQWPDVTERNTARITALQQYLTYLNKRLEEQDAEEASGTS